MPQVILPVPPGERLAFIHIFQQDLFGENLPLILSYFWPPLRREDAERTLVQIKVPAWWWLSSHYTFDHQDTKQECVNLPVMGGLGAGVTS